MEARYREGEPGGASGAVAARCRTMEGQSVESGDDARHATRQRVLVAGALLKASGPPQRSGFDTIHRRGMAGGWREDDGTKPAKSRGRTRDRQRIRDRQCTRARHNPTTLVRRRARVELRQLHSSPGVGVQLIHLSSGRRPEMGRHSKKSRIYWRERGGTRRAYADLRDFADVGGGREALVAEGEK